MRRGALSLRETFMADRAQYERDSLGFADDATGLSVYFKAGYRTIDPVYGDNGATLDRILAAIGTIQRDPRSRLLCIRIVGQASPEGSGPVNEVLSLKRGEALRDYLQSRSDVSASCFDVRSRGARGPHFGSWWRRTLRCRTGKRCWMSSTIRPCGILGVSSAA